MNADVLMRAGIPESLISRTLQALQTLDLIDKDGKPTPTFEGIRLAPETEYKKRLEDWLKGTYADVFTFVDPSTDDETRVRDAFRTYNPVAQQPRMVALFRGLCAAAGLTDEKKAQPIPRTILRPRPITSTVRRTAPLSPLKRTPKQTTPGSTQAELPAPLAGLLASLPANRDGWTKDARDKFLTTFTAVLDYCIPIEDEAEKETAAVKRATAA